ncbi:MAG: HVO_0649 family zinc finger protein [Salinigranum sp.]
MGAKRAAGTTALDRLCAHYDDVDLRCPKCGYEDERGRWQAWTTGRRIDYRHVCPSCGAIRRRTLRLR